MEIIGNRRNSRPLWLLSASAAHEYEEDGAVDGAEDHGPIFALQARALAQVDIPLFHAGLASAPRVVATVAGVVAKASWPQKLL